MKTATVKLEGISPYSQSRNYEREVPKLDKERPDEYRARTWRNALHVDRDGFVVIPGMALKNCLSEGAKFLSLQIPGKGKATYTKHIEAGVLVPEHARLDGFHAENALQEDLFLPSSGKRGDGKRVWKSYPLIPAGWTATATFVIGDDVVTRDVFEQILSESGKFIGIGRWRVRQNGQYGRFLVKEIQWK